MISETNSATKRIERIERVKRLLIWPLLLWIALMVLTFLVRVPQVKSVEPLRKILESLVLYSLPVILLYIATITFISSYKILESRGYKNLASFLIILGLASFLMDAVGVEIPKVDKLTSVLLAGIVAAVIVLAMHLVQRFIKMPSEDAGADVIVGPPSTTLGAVISGFVSLIIASVSYFQVREGVSFVTWGVFFGILLSVILFSSDKIVMGLLCFLDPAGAWNMFRLLRIKRELEAQRDAREVKDEIAAMREDKMKDEMIELAETLRREYWRTEYSEAKHDVEALIRRLQDSSNLPVEEKRRIRAEVDAAIEHIRVNQTLPALPPPDYSSYSLGEKVYELVGLDEDEIEEAVREGLIELSQSHLWSVPAQIKIRQALNDFDKEYLVGTAPIFVARTWATFFEANARVAESLMEKLVSATEADFVPVKGSERWGLSEIRFGTVTRSYSGVIRFGAGSIRVVIGVVEVPVT